MSQFEEKNNEDEEVTISGTPKAEGKRILGSSLGPKEEMNKTGTSKVGAISQAQKA